MAKRPADEFQFAVQQAKKKAKEGECGWAMRWYQIAEDTLVGASDAQRSRRVRVLRRIEKFVSVCYRDRR